MTQPPNASTPPGIGSQIGPYRIDGLLSQGAMGLVYAGTDTRLHRPVAIKIVVASLAQSSAFLARFDREAAIMARLESPHVIAVYDHGTHEGWPYLVSQYAAGGDLARLIRQYGGMPVALAANICAQVADALAAAHAVGVVHRDVKPENVLLRDERMDRPHVYLGDFGVAHTDSSGMTQPGSVAGTWNYLAPERAEGDPGSPAGDIYALGCLFYEAVTGRAPYTGSDVEVALAHLGGEVPQLPGDDDLTRRANVILARVLAKDPAQRPASAVEVRDQLQLLSGSGEAYAAGPSVRTRGRSTGRTVAVGAAGAVLLAAIAGGGVWLGTRDTSATPGDDASAAAKVTRIVGDLDGDGKGDMLLGRGFDNVQYADEDTGSDTLFTSTGKAFKAGTPESTLPKSVVTGDIDGDGKIDLVSISGQHSAYQLRTDAQDVPGSVIRVPYWDDVVAVFSADIDGDGRDDVGVASLGDGKNRSMNFDDPGDLHLRISVLESTKDGWSRTMRMYDEPWRSDNDLVEVNVDAGDLDGDGDADLVLGTDEAPAAGVLISDGNKLTPSDVTLPSDLDVITASPLLADLDGDGTAELVLWDTGHVHVLSYDPSGAWKLQDWTATVPKLGSYEQSIADPSVSDVDGDGDSDVVFVITDYGSGKSRLQDKVVVMASDPKTKKLTSEMWAAPGGSKVNGLDKGIGASASKS